MGQGEVEDRFRESLRREGCWRLQVLLSSNKEGVQQDSFDEAPEEADSPEACWQAGITTAPEEVMYKSKGKYKATKKSKPTTKKKALKQFKAVKAAQKRRKKK
jgi:hypothetical protein